MSSPENDNKQYLGDRLITYVVYFATLLIDGAFLVAWAVVQKLLDIIIAALTLYGISAFTAILLQVIFAFTTVAPILIYVVKDTSLMARRAIRQLKEDIAASKTTLSKPRQNPTGDITS